MNKEGVPPGQNPVERPAGQEATASPEDIDRYWQRESFELNGKEVDFIGVSHLPETAERYGKELEEAIGRASVVVLEAAPVAERIYSNEMVDALEELARQQGRTMTREEIIEMLEQAPGLRFYRAMEHIAAEKGTPIATLDPARHEPLVSKDRLTETDMKLAWAKLYIALGGTAGFVGLEAAEGIREARRGARERREAREAESRGEPAPARTEAPLMSRRQFLGRALGGAAALVGGSLFASGLNASGKRGRKDNPIGPLLYDALDYRDTCVAKGLDALTKKSGGRGADRDDLRRRPPDGHPTLY